MREAQKMMQSPEFQQQMKKMAEHPSFKQAMTQTQTLMKDPKKVKEIEAQMKKAVQDGEKALEDAQKKSGDEGEKEAAAPKEEESDELEVPNLNIN